MGKKKKGMGGFNVPIVVFRTPEQHRMIIQPQVVAKPLPASHALHSQARAAPDEALATDGRACVQGAKPAKNPLFLHVVMARNARKC